MIPRSIQVQPKSAEEILIDKKKKAAEEEKKKKIAAKKEKRFFDVKVDALIPTMLTYRILANDEEDALTQIKNKHPTNIKPNLNLKRLIKATVYDAGSLIIRLVKRF